MSFRQIKFVLFLLPVRLIGGDFYYLLALLLLDAVIFSMMTTIRLNKPIRFLSCCHASLWPICLATSPIYIAILCRLSGNLKSDIRDMVIK